MPNPTQHQPRPIAKAAAAALQFKGLHDWIEVFRTGTHTDAKGQTATFAATDLDEMASNVTGAGVPVVVGHPTDESASYAWGKEFKREGDSLLVKLSDVNPDFEAAVDAGAYRERSLKIFNDPDRGWVVQHIGWLGGVPPAIKGMAPLQYSQCAAVPDGVEALEFMDSSEVDTGWGLTSVATLLRGLRDWVIAKDGLDTANQVLPDWQIQSVADAATRVTDAGYKAPADADDGSGANPALVTYAAPAGGVQLPAPGGAPAPAVDALQQARKQAAAEATAAAELRFSAQAAELATLRAERQRDRHRAQITAWQAQGRATPAEVVGMVEFMAALEGGQAGVFAFSAADNSAASKTPAQWFSDFMAARQVVKLGRQDGQRDEPGQAVDLSDANAINKAAQEFQAAEQAVGRTWTMTEAIVQVTRKAAGR